MKKGLWGAIAVTALFVLYVVAVVGRGLALIGTGNPVGILLGLGALLLPLVCIALIIREWMLASSAQSMANVLAHAGELPVDELPRSPGGRIDKQAAREAFLPAREQAQAHPQDWKAWYNLAFAYDAAGDRRRARAALRKASGFFRASARQPRG